MSESNYRFERGVDPVAVEEASLRACQLIVELAGGQVAEGSADVWAKPLAPWQVTLRPQRTTKLLGLEIPPQRQAEILTHLGLQPRLQADAIVCTIPTSRADLTREVDLIEEIARLEGYDKIPVASRVTHAVSAEGVAQRVRRELGAVLVAAGFDEALTPTFVDAGENELFGLREPVAVDARVRRSNNVLRGTLTMSLLRCCKTNQDAGIDDLSLFELAKVFPRQSEPRPEGSGFATGDSPSFSQTAAKTGTVPFATLPQEFTELGLVTTRELRDLRGAIEALVERLARQAKLEFCQQDVAGFVPGAAAGILLDGEHVGDLGMVDATVLAHYGLEKPLAAGRLNFESLLARAGAVRTYQPLPRFPSVERDLSIIVPDAATWRQIEQAVVAVPQPMRSGMEYVTTYRGKPIPAGSKSVTVRLTYRSGEGTLRSVQVDEQVQQVVDSLKSHLGAEIRK